MILIFQMNIIAGLHLHKVINIKNYLKYQMPEMKILLDLKIIRQ